MSKKTIFVLCLLLITLTLFIGCIGNEEMYNVYDEDIQDENNTLIEKSYDEEIQEEVKSNIVIDTNDEYGDLSDYINIQFEKMDISGMAVAIVDGDDMTFFSGNGYMNIKNKIPVSEDTIFLIASITKTITGTAVMQLVQQGEIDLDKDINEYLPYEVYNPFYPDEKITTRMLLCHTSSILDNWDVMDESYSYGKNPDIGLQEYCQDYFDIHGKYYNEDYNFLDKQPGTYYEYSNCGYAMLGSIVENITDKQFFEFCDQNIFSPLGMENTSLMLEDLDIDKIAIPYNDGEAIEHYTFATYPDGGLRTSSEDFAKFISMMINEGSYKDEVILTSETVNMVLQDQYIGVANNQGLTWDLAINEIYNVYSDNVIVGHNGGEYGAETLMFFNPDSEKGALIFINDELNKSETKVYDEIVQKLVDVIS